MITHASLFSGIGGFDLAAEWTGWENIFHCEINPFGQKVLKYHFPKSISYEDIKTTDFTIHRGRIDVLSGGFPCQPYSLAGKRLGKEDERHLWPEMLRAIKELQPRYVVGENVFGIVNWNEGVVFDEVQADLEAAGYEVQPFILPACAKNAPHRRDRVWFIAHRNVCGQLGDKEWEERFQCRNGRKALSIANGNGSQKIASNSNSTIEQRKRICEKKEREFNGLHSRTGINRWDIFPTQSPICGRDDGLSRELDGITFSKWKEESIKAYGNAIVPQVAFEIFSVIDKIINDEREFNPEDK